MLESKGLNDSQRRKLLFIYDKMTVDDRNKFCKYAARVDRRNYASILDQY